MEIVLTREAEELIRQQVASGAYASPSEVIASSLRLFKQKADSERVRLEELRREIQIGLDEAKRGEGAPLDMDAIIAEVEANLRQD